VHEAGHAVGHGALPPIRIRDRVEKGLTARVEGELDAVAVPLLLQDALGGHRPVVEESFELIEFGVDEPTQVRSDVDVTAGEFEAHVSPFQ
jgi:hypothetical protein